jgi:membrane protease YdiL (CAAX protease family)
MSSGTLLANVALTQGLFGGIVLGGALLFEIPAGPLGVGPGPLTRGLPALGLGIGFGLALWLANEASAALADAVGAGYDESLRELLTPESRDGWAVLLGFVLPLVALVEEFLFRAAIIGVPAAGFGLSPWALAVVSGAQGRVGIAVTGGLGFVLAAGFILTGSLLVVVVAHYLVNAMEFLVHEAVGADRLLG